MAIDVFTHYADEQSPWCDRRGRVRDVGDRRIGVTAYLVMKIFTVISGMQHSTKRSAAFVFHCC